MKESSGGFSRLRKMLENRYGSIAAFDDLESNSRSGIELDLRMRPVTGAGPRLRLLGLHGGGLFVFLYGSKEPLWEGDVDEVDEISALIDSISSMGVVWRGWPIARWFLWRFPRIEYWNGRDAIHRFDPPWRSTR